MSQKIPRGIRNNNPGNIDYNPNNNWQGQLSHDPSIEKRFARFKTPFYGIRALAKLLLNYRRLHGLRTVSQIISRWAPTSENSTHSYISAVANELGVSSDTEFALNQKNLERLTAAVIRHENGRQPYADDLIARAVQDALA